MKLLHLLFVALCSWSPPEAAIRSEIGDGALRPAKIYPDEEISLTLWQSHGDPPDQLSIVIKPDRALHVRRYDVDRSQERSKLITHTLDTKHVSERAFDKLLTRLSAYRPEKLAEGGPLLLPKGCNFISHGPSIVSVWFQDANEKSGIFVLQKGCTGESAARIEADLKDILSKLPELDGTKGYGWSGS